MGRVILQVQAKLSRTGDDATNLYVDYLGEWELRLDGGNKVQDGVQDGTRSQSRLQYALSLRTASGRICAGCTYLRPPMAEIPGFSGVFRDVSRTF